VRLKLLWGGDRVDNAVDFLEYDNRARLLCVLLVSALSGVLFSIDRGTQYKDAVGVLAPLLHQFIVDWSAHLIEQLDWVAVGRIVGDFLGRALRGRHGGVLLLLLLLAITARPGRTLKRTVHVAQSSRHS
jgi:hypothetical protein